MNNKLITLVITMVVGIILAGSVLMPVLTDAQKNIGEEVHYDNIQSGYTYRLTEKNENITLKITGSGGDIYFNDEAITEDGFAIVTDSVSARANTTGKTLVITTPTQNLDLRVSWASQFTITFEDGVCTIVDDSTTTTKETVSYSWMFSPADNGEWVTVTGSTTHYVNSINDIICNGYYSTGENDTGYTVRNGVASVSDSSYTADLSYTLTPVSGTTDVYTLSTFEVVVGDESFTPWFLLVHRDITGHVAGGAPYSLLGAIPIIVLASLVVAAVGFVAFGRRD